MLILIGSMPILLRTSLFVGVFSVRKKTGSLCVVQRSCQLSSSQFAPPRFFADRKHAYSFAPAVAKKSGGDCVRFSVSANHQALSLLTPAFFCGGAKRNFLDSVVTPAAKPKACILYRLRGTFDSVKDREKPVKP